MPLSTLAFLAKSYSSQLRPPPVPSRSPLALGSLRSPVVATVLSGTRRAAARPLSLYFTALYRLRSASDRTGRSGSLIIAPTVELRSVRRS